MAKIILEFDSFEEREEADSAINGWKYKSRLDDIWGALFRPRWKHGYHNERLNELIESSPEVNEAIDLLEEIYKEVVRDE